jgi:hypothetical protein
MPPRGCASRARKPSSWSSRISRDRTGEAIGVREASNGLV